jgi:uncharacterized protein YbjT (DUF2867 family)
MQGGSVAKYLLKDGTFTVRAITRSPDGAPAKGPVLLFLLLLVLNEHPVTALAAQGAQVVKADSRDAASLEKAFEGVYGVFGVTNCEAILRRLRGLYLNGPPFW